MEKCNLSKKKLESVFWITFLQLNTLVQKIISQKELKHLCLHQLILNVLTGQRFNWLSFKVHIILPWLSVVGWLAGFCNNKAHLKFKHLIPYHPVFFSPTKSVKTRSFDQSIMRFLWVFYIHSLAITITQSMQRY